MINKLSETHKQQILDIFDNGGTFLSSRKFGWCWMSSAPNNFTIAQGLYSYEIILENLLDEKGESRVLRFDKNDLLKALEHTFIKEDKVGIELRSLNKCFIMQAAFFKRDDNLDFYKLRISYSFTEGQTAIFAAQNFKKLDAAYSPLKKNPR